MRNNPWPVTDYHNRTRGPVGFRGPPPYTVREWTTPGLVPPDPANDNVRLPRRGGLPPTLPPGGSPPASPYRPGVLRRVLPWAPVLVWVPDLVDTVFQQPPGVPYIPGWTHYRSTGLPREVNWQQANTADTVHRFWWIDLQAGGEPLGSPIPNWATGLFLGYYNPDTQRWASIHTYTRPEVGQEHEPSIPADQPRRWVIVPGGVSPFPDDKPLPRYRDAAGDYVSPWPYGYVSVTPRDPVVEPWNDPDFPVREIEVGVGVPVRDPLDDPATPLPKREPLTQPKPATLNPYRAPPDSRTRERKPKLKGGRIAVKIAVTAVVSAATEAMDVIRPLWEALPKEYRSKLKAGQPLPYYMAKMSEDLWNHYDKIDMEKAIKGIVANQVQDFLLGKLSDRANKEWLKANEDLGRHPITGLETGNAFDFGGGFTPK